MSSLPRATVHLSNIADNWRTLDRLHPGATTAAVVKADAYGLGAARVSRALVQAGCDTFFVAYAEEGATVRKAVGAAPRIFVLNGPSLRDVRAIRENNLTVVLSSDEHVDMWRRSGGLPCALHFDTGMNRLGLDPEVLAKGGDTLRKLAPVLVMSHLACADEPESPMNAAQLKAFDAIAAAFPDTPSSLANSAGCYLGKAYAHDLTRPGIALYGGSAPPARVALQPAVTLEAQILSVFSAKAGETVGYGATHTLAADATLATVGLGYADGLLRSGSDRLIGWIGGTACPVLGRVSMDLVTLDVSKAQPAAKAGSRVEFLGPHAKLEEQAARAGTLGYELLTGLGSRVERVYQ
ncbi:MAG: alanine racemase [Hyphomonas sp.]